MDITAVANMSMQLSASKTMQSVDLSVTKMAMDSTEQVAQGMVDALRQSNHPGQLLNVLA